MSLENKIETAPYFEAVARDFYCQFGEDALEVVDHAIESLKQTGPEFALEMWQEIRLTLICRSPAVSTSLQ